MTVGPGMGVGTRNYLLLHGIASEPYKDTIINVDDFDMLHQIVPATAYALCNGTTFFLYMISYYTCTLRWSKDLHLS